MKFRMLRPILFTLAVTMISTGMIFAQGHGGGGHGGPGGPPGGGGNGGGWGEHDSTGHGGPGDGGDCDSTGHDSSGYGGGWGHWGPGDSTGHDSSGHGGHHWGHGDSTNFDSVFVSGLISTSVDTMTFGEGEFIHTSYFLDINDDMVVDYRLAHMQGLLQADSNFVMPVDGDHVEVMGFLVTSEERLDRIIVRDLVITDTDLFGTLATDPAITGVSHSLQTRNYPNPFNPSTTIEFTLETAGHVSLTIYDITGAQAATLIDDQLAAGLHSLHFNPGSMSAGTYLYVLETGSQREVSRIAYLK